MGLSGAAPISAGVLCHELLQADSNRPDRRYCCRHLSLAKSSLRWKIVVDGFVKLLQMTVLPYLIISIISSLGSLTYADARRLGLRVGGVMVALWALALTFALLMPLAFPPTQHATFFSNTMVEHRPPFNILDLYIPSNPFNALATTWFRRSSCSRCCWASP